MEAKKEPTKLGALAEKQLNATTELEVKILQLIQHEDPDFLYSAVALQAVKAVALRFEHGCGLTNHYRD